MDAVDYEMKAIQYQEKYGILEGTVKGNKFTYHANYPEYLSEPRRTYKIIVDLDRMKEESRTLLKRWNKAGNNNMYL